MTNLKIGKVLGAMLLTAMAISSTVLAAIVESNFTMVIYVSQRYH